MPPKDYYDDLSQAEDNILKYLISSIIKRMQNVIDEHGNGYISFRKPIELNNRYTAYGMFSLGDTVFVDFKTESAIPLDDLSMDLLTQLSLKM